MAKLVEYGGQGYEHSSEIGVFEVRATKRKRFYSLNDAIEYYESLFEDKFMWDLTTTPELIIGHTLEP